MIAIRLVRTRRGCAVCERQDRYDVLLFGKLVGQLYYNLRGYVGTLPTPSGHSLVFGEAGIATFKREAARLNREFSEAAETLRYVAGIAAERPQR